MEYLLIREMTNMAETFVAARDSKPVWIIDLGDQIHAQIKAQKRRGVC